ncbi:MAG: hypothetical protein R3255_10730 [Candidatus Lokiarchaeia archaeon]|nr:hypothetical protein [Candidatus Lokiarchaeia archaeon]
MSEKKPISRGIIPEICLIILSIAGITLILVGVYPVFNSGYSRPSFWYIYILLMLLGIVFTISAAIGSIIVTRKLKIDTKARKMIIGLIIILMAGIIFLVVGIYCYYEYITSQDFPVWGANYGAMIVLTPLGLAITIPAGIGGIAGLFLSLSKEKKSNSRNL